MIDFAQLPAIGMGCMGLGGRYECDSRNDKNAIRIITKAHDLGVRLFDTAEVYGAGYGEVLLGKAVSYSRGSYFISSKFSAEHAEYSDVILACENSLKRLGSDYIDLYQCHWPNPNVPFEETLRALSVLKKQGKIRYAGFSNLTRTQFKNVLTICPEDLAIVSVQQDYSVIDRSVEYSILPFCQQNNCQLIAYSPLGQGKAKFTDYQLQILTEIAAELNSTIESIMLVWLSNIENVMAIPMTSNIDHLVSNLKALNIHLSKQQQLEIRNAFPSQIIEVETTDIQVVQSHTSKVFTTLEQAQNNTLNLSPSPVELAKDLESGDLLKPVKVRLKVGSDSQYELYEGQLRYWSWIIAHGGNKRIPALVEAS